MKKNSSSTQGERIFWEGPLFGRLPRSAKDYLVKQWGWKNIQNSKDDKKSSEQMKGNMETSILNDISGRLSFIWPNKSGPQLDMEDNNAAHMRPFPKDFTDIVDDKIQLADSLSGTSISPRRIVTIPNDAPDTETKRYFVKHRYGAQGKSVYVYDYMQLREWSKRTRNPQDFLIQDEIIPSLYEGRKFVIRSHLLVIQRSKTLNGGPSDGKHTYGKEVSESGLESYLHKTAVICQQHASDYSNRHYKSSHISQAGKNHPLPVLLQDLPDDHPAAQILPEMRSCSKTLLDATLLKESNARKIGHATTCFALLGVDILVDNQGSLQICEVNSHPALGWGTMSKVPQKVFSQLIQEALEIIFDKEAAPITEFEVL